MRRLMELVLRTSAKSVCIHTNDNILIRKTQCWVFLTTTTMKTITAERALMRKILASCYMQTQLKQRYFSAYCDMFQMHVDDRDSAKCSLCCMGLKFDSLTRLQSQNTDKKTVVVSKTEFLTNCPFRYYNCFSSVQSDLFHRLPMHLPKIYSASGTLCIG